VAELVDLVVARRILLDVGVAARQVRLRLVVVEVGDEVLDGVVREELAKLAVKLRGERLVVRQDECRPVPVAPSSTWWCSPRARPSVSRSIARGWSPVG
jgi:hypothetical protein